MPFRENAGNSEEELERLRSPSQQLSRGIPTKIIRLISTNRTSLWVKLNKDRFRVTIEICYCSLRAGGLTPSTTTETHRCPTPSAISFQQ